MLVSCPFYFYIHNHPCDYWRLRPAGAAARAIPQSNRRLARSSQRPANVWAVAFREEHPPVTPEQFEHYQTLLKSFAHEPQRWPRTLRYKLGRLLCGRGPFAPYLEQDRWETECRTFVYQEGMAQRPW